MASVTVRRTYDQCMEMYHGLVWEIARDVFGTYSVNPCQRLFLVGEKGTHSQGRNIWTALGIGGEDDRRLCVHPEPLPRNMTVEGLHDHINLILRTEPLWILAD